MQLKKIITIDSSFQSGKTIDITDNRYGIVDKLSGYSDKINTLKQVYIKDSITKNFTTLSASSFDKVYNKFKSNSTIFSQITSSKIIDLNVYNNTFSMDLLNYSIVDSFLYDTDYIEQINSPLIIEKDTKYPKLAFITKDCFNNGSIYKFNISLSGEKTFLYELFKYDTNKRILEEISTRNTETSTYFMNSFNFAGDGSIRFGKLINSELNYNSYSDSYILTTLFTRIGYPKQDTILLHYYNFKIINNKIKPIKNNIYTDLNINSNENLLQFFLARSKDEGTFNFLTGGDDLLVPTLSYPEDQGSSYTITLAYSGERNINFDLTNVPQTSAGQSLYKAEVDFGDGIVNTLYSVFQSDDTLKLENFNHRYTSFNSSISAPGSIKFYYENGNTTNVNLIILKLNPSIAAFSFKSINGQKINSGNFTLNFIDKNNTLYNLIDTK